VKVGLRASPRALADAVLALIIPFSAVEQSDAFVQLQFQSNADIGWQRDGDT